MLLRDAFRLPRDGVVCVLVCGVFAVVVALGVASGRFELASQDILPVFAAIATLFACGIGLDRLHVRALPDVLKVVSLYFLLAATAALASAVLAAADRPYVDDRLAAADA